MARHKLTDSKLKGLDRPGIYGDGDGLYLRVQPSGSRSWVFVWKRFGTRREIGLGPYGNGASHVGLAAARRKAQEAREIVGAGGDPKTEMTERKAARRAVTFGTVADEYVSAMQSKWRDKTLARWERIAAVYAKGMRRVPVDAVTVDDVVRVLAPLWTAKPETGDKVRQAIKQILDHAKARGLRTGDNPAMWTGHLDQILPRPAKLVRGHHAAMPYVEVPTFITRLHAVGGIGSLALEFLVLTAARSGEARGAHWTEIDMQQELWTIPADRMKAGKVHRVPLSARPLEILAAMRAKSTGDYVFGGQRDGRPISEATLTKALRAAGAGGATVHGFRSSFRDWVSDETLFQRELAEAALAHAVGDAVERAYRRGDALAKRRELMDAWAAYVSTKKGGENVVALGRKS